MTTLLDQLDFIVGYALHGCVVSVGRPSSKLGRPILFVSAGGREAMLVRFGGTAALWRLSGSARTSSLDGTRLPTLAQSAIIA